MSTKIYYAYRLPKTYDVIKYLNELTTYHTELIAEGEELLEMIHKMALLSAKNSDDTISKFALERNEEGSVDEYYLKTWLRNNTDKHGRLDIDLDFEVSIFYDEDYWYLKFFPNISVEFKTITYFEKMDGVEDFHYQNSTDPPSDIPYEDYELRDEKWDKLLEFGGGNYSKGFQYNIFTSDDFYNLLTKYHYTDEKDIYKHLSYKFPKIEFRSKTEDE